MIWTMEQVQQVRGLRAEVAVDVELVERYGERVLDEVAGQMAKRITDMAHPFGVEIDSTRRDDFEVVWEKRDVAPWTATGRLRWNPSTHTAELRGGHLDGQRYELREIGEPFRVARPAITPWFDAEADDTSAALVEIADVYEVVGWHEQDHVWVYAKT